MNIGFDSKRLYCNFTGLGNYSRSLVTNLQKFYPGNLYHLYTPRIIHNVETDFFNNNLSFHTHLKKTPFSSYWRSYSILSQLENDKVELYHGLSNEIPFRIQKTKIKSIVTIHDLIFKIYPDTYSFFDKTIYNLKFKNACLNSDKIIAISQNTKKDIVEHYGIAPEKIEVIYQSCNPLFYEPDMCEENSSILQQYNLPNEYLLYVGSIEKRKNLKGIIEAYQFLQSQDRIPLVIIGGNRDKSYKKEILTLINSMGIEKLMFFINHLNDNLHLRQIYKSALTLVYPSFYEGFGLPIAEALLCKTPVITSRVSSLTEAGGPGSIYINPEKPEEIAHAIRMILTNSSQNKIMAKQGHTYAFEYFSPEKLTHQLVNCYKNTLNS